MDNDKERRIEQMLDKREKMMKENGWIVDAVFDTGITGQDIHTHGLVESYGHPDIQCILPINAKVVHEIFCIIVNQIKMGKKFEAGKCYSGLVKGDYKIRFLLANESNRKVLRIIIPDKHGKLHKDLIEENFRVQFEGI